jgi:hypothetical protein
MSPTTSCNDALKNAKAHRFRDSTTLYFSILQMIQMVKLMVSSRSQMHESEERAIDDQSKKAS